MSRIVLYIPDWKSPLHPAWAVTPPWEDRPEEHRSLPCPWCEAPLESFVERDVLACTSCSFVELGH